MAKGKPLSAAHKAAISAGLKRYWASKGAGSGGRPASVTPKTGPRSGKPMERIAKAPSASLPASKAASRTSLNIDTGKQISREEAARIMFGSAGAAKKLASGKKRKARR